MIINFRGFGKSIEMISENETYSIRKNLITKLYADIFIYKLFGNNTKLY